MEARHLRFFCTVAQELHFTRSAELLNVSQPALSTQIKQLESELGIRLVERTNRRVRLTVAGEIFFLRAKGILEQMDQASREAMRFGQAETGRLTLGVVSTAVCSYLPAMLRSLRQESPHISVDVQELEPGEQVDALRKEKIDAGLLFLSIQDPAFDSVLISRERLIAAIPTGHPQASRDKLRLRDLAGETFLIPRRQSVRGYHELVLDTLRLSGVTAPRLQPIRLLSTATFLVSGHLGVALVPESFRQHLRIRGCVYRDLAGPPVHAELTALWRTEYRTPALRRFIKILACQDMKTV